MEIYFTDNFDTPLIDKEQSLYQKWLLTLPEYQRNNYDYDLQGAFKSGLSSDGGHFPDTYKKPNHETFSTQSQYSGISGQYGGHWIEINGRWFYFPEGQDKIRCDS